MSDDEKIEENLDESPEPGAAPEVQLDLSPHWSLDSSIIFLNHGSFGACPRRIQHHQSDLRRQMEAEPVRFFTRELPQLLNRVRADFAEFLGARPENLAFVTNATEGVNSVLRSLDLKKGDEILITDHGYGACNNASYFVAQRAGAKVVVAEIDYPVRSADDVVEAIVDKVTDRTRLALIDHITAFSGMVLPIEEIVAALKERGVETLVDGAHAPGMVEIRLDELGAAYYAGNCHKWLSTPRGAAFLHVRSDLLETVRPLSISHGATMDSPRVSRFHLEFDWTGTRDPTAWLCITESIAFLRSLFPGGWRGIRERNRELALWARDLLCDTVGTEPLCPDSMIGSLASVELPQGDGPPPASLFEIDPLQDQLFTDAGIEVPIFRISSPPKRVLRISAFLYNRRDHYRELASALSDRI